VRWFRKAPPSDAPAEAPETAVAGDTPTAPGPDADRAVAAPPGQAQGADARRIDARELRGIIGDADELRKGAEVFDRGGLQHLARHGERIFCEASGSGAAPYRVTVTLTAGGETRARCSCFAARSRPVCKHAAALLVAWARAPESFVASDAPPVVEGGGAPRAATVRTGKVKPEALMARGVEQTLALARELAIAGVATSAADRPDQVRALAESLRANRLRRLSVRVLELADLLDGAARRRGSIVPLAYADLVADLLLTARRIERHLAGEVLEDRQMEELVGRTWRKADRRPQAGLELMEYAYRVGTTADGFVIRERRLLDVPTAAHYSEKQILPAFLAKRTPPPLSQPGVRLTGTGSVYPSYPPQRMDLDGVAAAGPFGSDDLERLVEAVTAGPAAILSAYQEHRRDVFAPDRLPLAIRADALVAFGDRLALVGSDGDAIVLAEGDEILDSLGGDRLSVVIGDVDLDGILAIVHPLAVLVSGSSGMELRPVPARATQQAGAERSDVDRLAGARAAGASDAALSLAEVRDELSAVFVNGLGALVDRVVEPIATRLTDLGLERPSVLLREVAARPDPVDRLDDLVRLHQVLAIGAVRLSGAGRVDRESLIPVPGQPAVLIPDPGPPLDASEVARRRSAGTMTAYEAVVHRSRTIGALPDEAFLTILPWWADASAGDHVAASVSKRAAIPFDLIEEALSVSHGLTAALTAISILNETADPRADRLLRTAGQLRDPARSKWASSHQGYLPQRAMRVAAREALWVRAARDGGRLKGSSSTADPDVMAALVADLQNATRRERRAEAAEELAALDDRAVLPALRRAWRGDGAPIVRQAAARALTSLGDASLFDGFVDALVARSADPEQAKTAAYALGALGDVRGVAVLLGALADGWKPAVIRESLAHAGLVVVPSIVGDVLEAPDHASRQAFVSALADQPAPAVRVALLASLASLGDGPDAATRATAILRLAASHDGLKREVATRILATPRGDSSADRALARAAGKALA
jgi:HEAT repeats/SWIM zinc finger